jgi:DNA-directed RNA polymerase specialized sigma24 family protein
VCGISPEAMRQRLSRARAALAEQLHLPEGRPANRRYGT